MDERFTSVKAADLTIVQPGRAEIPAILVIAARALRTANEPRLLLLRTDRQALQRVVAARRRWRALALGLTAVATAATGAWLQGRSEPRSYSIRVPLPASAPISPDRLAARPAAVPIIPPVPRPQLAVVAAAAVVPSPVAGVPPSARPGLAERETRSEGTSLLRIENLAEARAAVIRSLRTGVAEPWTGAGLSGYAVAGPAQVAGRHVCRNVAIWAEGRAGDGAALPQRHCLGQGGGWTKIDAAPSVDLASSEPWPVDAVVPPGQAPERSDLSNTGDVAR